jgi:hypothetical protein
LSRLQEVSGGEFIRLAIIEVGSQDSAFLVNALSPNPLDHTYGLPIRWIQLVCILQNPTCEP